MAELHLVRSEELPPEFRERWDDIRTRMTSIEPVGSEGSLQATADRMTDASARGFVDAVVGMAFDVEAESQGG